MKQKIEFEIEVPDGKKAVWKDGKVVFESAELPKTWEGYCILNPRKTGEYYISSLSSVRKIEGRGLRSYTLDKNAFTSEEVARQHIAFMQLHRLRDCYRQGWTPNFLDDSRKWCIIKNNNILSVDWGINYSVFLSFQTKELAKQFLNNFEDLIEQAGDLI